MDFTILHLSLQDDNEIELCVGLTPFRWIEKLVSNLPMQYTQMHANTQLFFSLLRLSQILIQFFFHILKSSRIIPSCHALMNFKTWLHNFSPRYLINYNFHLSLILKGRNHASPTNKSPFPSSPPVVRTFTRRMTRVSVGGRSNTSQKNMGQI